MIESLAAIFQRLWEHSIWTKMFIVGVPALTLLALGPKHLKLMLILVAFIVIVLAVVLVATYA